MTDCTCADYPDSRDQHCPRHGVLALGGETGKAKEATRSRAGESSPAHADLELVRRRTAEEEPIRMISHAAPLRVIEWPQKGSAQRYPMGGWWVVELGEGGYSPVVGPFRTQAEAEADKAKRLTPDGQS